MLIAKPKYIYFELFILLIYLLITALIISGCSTEEKVWEQAIETNTIEGYTEYLSKYPDGINAEQAKDFVEELTWKKVKTRNDRNGYIEYVDIYPKGKYTETAKEEILWFDVTNDRSLEMFTDYRETYPNGKYLDLIPPIEIVSINRTWNYPHRYTPVDSEWDLVLIINIIVNRSESDTSSQQTPMESMGLLPKISVTSNGQSPPSLVSFTYEDLEKEEIPLTLTCFIREQETEFEITLESFLVMP
jgi:hypothetical protein